MTGEGKKKVNAFQSPRSGQICSNMRLKFTTFKDRGEFQSPRSGQICSNCTENETLRSIRIKVLFQSPRSGQICSNEREKRLHLFRRDNVSIP